MIELDDDHLRFSFPDVHQDARFAISFKRTLRIPDDGKTYPLPAGLGNFPVRHVDDYPERLPADTMRRGGVMLPMHASEAMWISFHSGRSWPAYPFAVKVAAGKINAVSGEAWSAALCGDSQDYMVVPGQPWLDGFAVEKGVIRQFVAEPLGSGHSVEEQLTGEAAHGGLQIIAYPMKRDRYEALRAEWAARRREPLCMPCMPSMAMGMAAGGLMKQSIEHDPYGIDAWDQSVASRCFVTLVGADCWPSITGEPAPAKPPTMKQYQHAGAPWFIYDSGKPALPGSSILAKVKSWAASKAAKQEKVSDNGPAIVESTIILKPKPAPSSVREMSE